MKRLIKVNSKLYRGGAPSIKDVAYLKNKLGIKKIVSLDKLSGEKIDRACKLLNIEHVSIPIDIFKKGSLVKFLHHNIYNLLMKNGPTYVHCLEGKDRTGLAIALLRCEYEGWSCKDALDEAIKIGFGIGVKPEIITLYKKIIKQACGCANKNNDVNDAYDIVDNSREYPSSYNGISSTTDPLSWAPYEDYRVREFPYSNVYNEYNNSFDNRQDYGLDDSLYMDDDKPVKMPQSGIFDTSSGDTGGAGPTAISGGFI